LKSLREGWFAFGLFADAKERCDSSAIDELELIREELVQIGCALGVEDQDVIELAFPIGEERKAQGFFRRQIVVGEVRVLERRSANCLNLPVRRDDLDWLLILLGENVGPEGTPVDQDERSEMPIGGGDLRHAAALGHDFVPCRIVFGADVSDEDAASGSDGFDDLANIGEVALRVVPNVGNKRHAREKDDCENCQGEVALTPVEGDGCESGKYDEGEHHGQS
jgi:hypothetical protein